MFIRRLLKHRVMQIVGLALLMLAMACVAGNFVET
jgi:hypothetical protein